MRKNYNSRLHQWCWNNTDATNWLRYAHTSNEKLQDEWLRNFICHNWLHIYHIEYRRSLYAEYAVCVGHQLPGGTIQLLKKTLSFYISIKININKYKSKH